MTEPEIAAKLHPDAGFFNRPTIWKSTIIVYSPFDPTEVELVDLAQDATDGRSFCPFYTPEVVDPATEVGFPHEFFNNEES